VVGPFARYHAPLIPPRAVAGLTGGQGTLKPAMLGIDHWRYATRQPHPHPPIRGPRRGWLLGLSLVLCAGPARSQRGIAFAARTHLGVHTRESRRELGPHHVGPAPSAPGLDPLCYTTEPTSQEVLDLDRSPVPRQRSKGAARGLWATRVGCERVPAWRTRRLCPEVQTQARRPPKGGGRKRVKDHRSVSDEVQTRDVVSVCRAPRARATTTPTPEPARGSEVWNPGPTRLEWYLSHHPTG
jgi:hypothetical protein